MRKIACCLAALLRGCLFPVIVWAQGPRLEPESGSIVIHDFAFGSGEKLENLNLHYFTLGTPVRDDAFHITNAVLLPHGTTGSAETFLQHGFADALYGTGQPLDLAKVFLVIPDGIGAGESSKPSDGLHARFPHYGYRDQVRAQHELLDEIGIVHLKLVLGTSMGAMQTWLWGETYPNDMDGLVAIAGTPAAITGRNMIWRQMIIRAIREDPDWKNGDYAKEAPPRAWTKVAMPLFNLMTGNAAQLQREAPTRGAAAELLNKLEARAKTVDANDYLYTFESSADYDPAPALNAIVKPMLTINFADDLLNPPESLDLPKSPNFTAAMLGGGPSSYGHQTQAHAELWAPVLKVFLDGLPGRR